MKAKTRSGLQGLPGGLDALVHRHHGEVVVVQPGAAELGVGKIKAQGLHQVQFGAGDGGEPDGVARIAGDFRGVEEDAEHGPILAKAGAAPAHGRARQCMSAEQSGQGRDVDRIGRRPGTQELLEPADQPGGVDHLDGFVPAR